MRNKIEKCSNFTLNTVKIEKAQGTFLEFTLSYKKSSELEEMMNEKSGIEKSYLVKMKD